MSGHFGFVRTYCRIRERFFWRRIENSVRNYVRNCKECLERKPDPQPSKGLLQPMPYPTEPFDTIGIDLMGFFL